jgi:hypothetical protein
MKGLSFYFFLRNKLKKNDIIGYSKNKAPYLFDKWSVEGDLVFSSKNVKITIPMEVIIICIYWNKKSIQINYDFLLFNKLNHYCNPPVLNYLIKNYNSTK